MDLVAAHTITVLSMFASCFLTCLLPSIIHIHADPNSLKKKLLSRLKSYSNCLSGGVFAGAFFTQYYPHVINEFEQLFTDVSIWRHPMQLGPSLVFLGFLLTALLERVVDVITHRFKKRSSATTARRAPDQELVSTSSRGPLLLDDASDEEGTVEADAVEPQARFSALAKEDDLDFKVIHSGTTSSNSSAVSGHHGHSHHHHHHHQHGSAALDDYQGITRFIVFVTSLGAHSIFEGLALGLIKNVDLLMTMFIGVITHEVLMGLAIGISLSRQKMKLRSKVLFCFIFSIIIPVGQGIGLLVQQAHSGVIAVMAVLQALAAGTFLHVMFLEILPQEMHNHFGVIEALWVAVGYCLIPLSSLITGEHKGH